MAPGVSSFPIKSLICVSIYVFLIYPLRFKTAAALLEYVRDDGRPVFAAPYPQLVTAGIIRMLLGGLWGLPFGACAYEIYLYVFVYEASRAGNTLARVGKVFSAFSAAVPIQTLGMAVVLTAFIAALLLFLYGWHRGVCYDFQMEKGQNALSALEKARRVRKKAKKDLSRNALIHFLILTPPLMAFSLVLIWGFQGVSQAAMAVQLALSAGIILDPPVFAGAAAALLAFYLPAILYRKARNAAVVMHYDQYGS